MDRLSRLSVGMSRVRGEWSGLSPLKLSSPIVRPGYRAEPNPVPAVAPAVRDRPVQLAITLRHPQDEFAAMSHYLARNL